MQGPHGHHLNRDMQGGIWHAGAQSHGQYACRGLWIRAEPVQIGITIQICPGQEGTAIAVVQLGLAMKRLSPMALLLISGTTWKSTAEE